MCSHEKRLYKHFYLLNVASVLEETVQSKFSSRNIISKLLKMTALFFASFLILPTVSNFLDQRFSTGMPQNPWVPRNALRVPPISELDWFTSKFYLGCCQIIYKRPRKGAAKQKRLRNTALDYRRV